MQPQYPVEPEVQEVVSNRAIKELDFFYGRRLCTDERRIREVWTYDQLHKNDPEIVLRMARVLAWFHSTPVTASVKYTNGLHEAIVVEPSDMDEEPTICFERYLSSKRKACSKIVTSDLERVHNRIMDLQMQVGEFSVNLMIDGIEAPFFVLWHSNESSWKLLGPNRTKGQVDQDLLKNFNEVMESISCKVNGAGGGSYDSERGVYVFRMWDVVLHTGNIERVKRAIESTGWTVVELENNLEDIKLVIR